MDTDMRILWNVDLLIPLPSCEISPLLIPETTWFLIETVLNRDIARIGTGMDNPKISE